MLFPGLKQSHLDQRKISRPLAYIARDLGNERILLDPIIVTRQTQRLMDDRCKPFCRDLFQAEVDIVLFQEIEQEDVRAAQIEVVGPDCEDDAEPEHSPWFNETEHPINERRSQTLGCLRKEFLELVDNQQRFGRLGRQVALQGIGGLLVVPMVDNQLSQLGLLFGESASLSAAVVTALRRLSKGADPGAPSLRARCGQAVPAAEIGKDASSELWYEAGQHQ